MKKLHMIIAEIFLTSALLINPAKADISHKAEFKNESLNELIYNPDSQITLSDSSPKLILKRAQSSDEIQLAGHRSHSSHRSHYSSRSGHRSHYSHYSHYQNTPLKSEDSVDKKTTKPYQLESTSKPSNNKLGFRILSIGMSGSDVAELKELLKAKKYKLISDEKFDALLEATLKDFQSKNNIPVDGKAGPLTIYFLKH